MAKATQEMESGEATEVKLDFKNRRILLELEKDSRISLSDLGRKVGLSKEVVFHRINNLVKNGIILRFQAVISTYRLGYQANKLYFKLQNLSPTVRTQLHDFLMKDDRVFWIGYCQGRWDLIIAFWAKNSQEIGEFEDELLNRFSMYIQEREFSISRRSLQYNRRWFVTKEMAAQFPGYLEPVEMTFGEDLEPIKIDDVDTKILRHLAGNARIRISELAELTKLSPSTVGYRIKQLEKKKMIVGYKCGLDAHRLGRQTCKACISFRNLTKKKRNAFIEYCKLKPETQNIILTVGPWDVEIAFDVRNFEEYYLIMNDIQSKFSDIIKGYESVLYASEPKQSFMPGAR
ncbi:putative HTH-type transcriptional regulator [uncultured archaeon]|nr:putative HTH-type transcriptional regulator [uncultured archaeon]